MTTSAQTGQQDKPRPRRVNIRPGQEGSSAYDGYFSLRQLAAYSCLSEHLTDSFRPLPHCRVGGKILVRRSEFDAWMVRYRRAGAVSVDAIVDDVLRDLQ